jgi:hypothetical protein
MPKIKILVRIMTHFRDMLQDLFFTRQSSNAHDHPNIGNAGFAILCLLDPKKFFRMTVNDPLKFLAMSQILVHVQRDLSGDYVRTSSERDNLYEFVSRGIFVCTL